MTAPALSDDADDTDDAPLIIAVREALHLRRQYGASPTDIEYLLGRWRWLHGVPLREHEIKTAAFAAVLEVPLTALTRAEAEGVIEASIEAYDGDLARSIDGLRRWCLDRGGVTPTVVARLCEAVRTRCVLPLERSA